MSWGALVVIVADSPDVVTGKRLLDAVKRQGFVFRRIAPGSDGPLEGVREVGEWRDTIHLGGFSSGCYAWRERQSSLIVPGGAAGRDPGVGGRAERVEHGADLGSAHRAGLGTGGRPVMGGGSDCPRCGARRHPAGIRWVFAAGLAHVLTDAKDAAAFVAVCGLTVPATVPVYRVAPSLDVCRACDRLTVFGVALPEFPTTPSVF